MALNKLERTLICNSSLLSRALKRVATREIQRVMLCGFAIALVPCGISFAQPSSAGRRSDGGYVWPRPEGKDSTYRPGRDGRDARFNGPYAGGKLGSISSIVTLHEPAAHHVPGRAIKEYERALKAKDKGDDENAIMCFKKPLRLIRSFALSTTSVRLI
jgi:hypothetical protein